MTTVTLPVARSRRWQPLRSGLMNIFRYDYEEFHYERGHLLLRGNNGAGKSRILALQLPFLLDADASPTRLEPDADQAKRIEWNLLVNRHDSRTGYTWIEFGRVDDDGAEHYVTLGCGLHAVQGRTGATKWFFVTHQRIGRDLFLQTPQKQALNQDGLKHALGAEGQLFTTADAYRKAVDLALFQLGPERYGALVDLLVKLRQPQLSRNLDEAVLSKALSDALAPLPPTVVTEIADSFRSLEDDEAKLRTMESARDGAQAFVRHYMRYCKIAAYRRAEDVRLAHSDYEGAQRELREHEEKRERAAAAERAAELAMRAAAAELADVDTRVGVLEDSEVMRDAEALRRARTVAEERAGSSRAAEARREEAARMFGKAEASHADAAQAADRARDALARTLAAAADAAAVVDLAAEHGAVISAAGLPGPGDATKLQQARRAVAEVVEGRKRAAARVRACNKALASAEMTFQQKQELRVRAEEEVARTAEAAAEAHAQVEREGTALRARLRAWAGTLRELTIAALETVDDELARWCELAEGDNPLTLAVHRAADDARGQLAAASADARQRELEVRTRVDDLYALRRRLAAGTHDPPPSPHTRDPQRRVQRPGAPLWQVCDFRPEVEATARAGLEAALESAGLLDAWVTPDGALLAPDEPDAALVAGTCALAREPLSKLLCVDVDDANPRVAPAAVDAILARIGAVEGGGEVWVDANGRWQLGVLRGAWHKSTAEHIGATAREVHRRRRLAELEGQIEAGERELSGVREELAALTGRSQTLKAELASAPKDDPIRRAHATLAERRAQLDRLRGRLVLAEAEVVEARRAVDAARSRRDADARDLGLVRWVEDMEAHDEALGDYRQAVGECWPAAERQESARQQLVDAAMRLDAARERRDADAAAADSAAAAARAARVAYETLEQTHGLAVRELVAQLEGLRTLRVSLADEQRRQEKIRGECSVAVAVADADVRHAGEEMAAHDKRRGAAIAVLQRFVGRKLLAVACPDLADVPEAGEEPWAAKRAVELARRVDQALDGTSSDDVAWGRVQRTVVEEYEQLQQKLRSLDFTPAMIPEDDGLYVFTVPFRGQVQSIPEFLDTLNEEIRTRQALLEADERRILEEHLIGEIAAHLHDLLHHGEQWVKNVNRVLESRATSTGMTLRFVWVPAEDGPPELAAARTRLLRSAALWSPQEREEVGRFLQAQIRRTRAADEHATWQEHLERAFDYRGWLRMVVERKQEGEWKRLTKRTHGTGSGGEKAIALTLPQFAAAAAHYDSAHPLAPRLILLDEAFVGVDSDMRSKCMSFLEHFDLDFVMTSEREWGCYATLSGVAIYQLVTRPGIWAVGMTRWVWNGRERVRTEVPSAPPRPPTGSPRLTLVAEEALDGDDERDGV